MVQFRFNLVEVVGVVPLAETPRSDVTNVVLCQHTYSFPSPVRQSVLLPQNGSHPQLRPKIRVVVQKENSRHKDGCSLFGGDGRS